MASDPDITDLTADMSDVARSLQHHESVQQTWEAVALLATQRLPGVQHAGVTVVRRGRPSTPAASGDLPRAVDALQYETGEGPCLDAAADGADPVYRTGDLGAEHERWPVFGPAAAERLGVRSMVSYQLFVQADTLGALNFYSMAPDAFDDAVTRRGAAFAAHAALAAANARDLEKVVNLEHALATSRVIGAAVGILMAQHRLTEPRAFEVLRAFSQNQNRKLRDVADDVVQTGAVPEPEPRRRRD